MGTVGSALSALIWPIAVAISIAILISLLPFFSALISLGRFLYQFVTNGQRGDLPHRTVELAMKQLHLAQAVAAAAPVAGPAVPPAGAAAVPAPGVAPPPASRRSQKLKRVLEKATKIGRSVLTVLPAFIRFLIFFTGVAIASWIGIELLYIPMVSTSYRALYEAYCNGDAVASLVSEKSGSGNLISVASYDGCIKKEGEPQNGATVLSHEEIFYLLDRLGLRNPRERTPEDLFQEDEHGKGTSNHKLAKLLGTSEVYVVGTPTSALVTRLAASVASGFAVHGPDDPGADDIVCQTAGLAAVLAQQPYTPTGAEQTIGRVILANGGAPLAVLFDPKVADVLAQKHLRVVQQTDKDVTFSDRSKVSLDAKTCAGDDALAAHGLGREFLAAIPWHFGLYIPLLARPDERLSDGEIVTVALNWVRWQPPTSADDRISKQAVLDFMRNIVSEASGLPTVRQGRIAVNFFIGWERLAILVVSTFLVLCLLWQQASIVDDKRHFQYINKVVRLTKTRSQVLVQALRCLRNALFWSIGRSAPREVLDAAVEMINQGQNRGSVDRYRLRRAAEHELRIMDRGRIFFLVGLPLLPTLGFLGTVRSLIEALGIADNIPRARDAVSQVAAVADVTSTLSLCFSTTFMALMALLILAPLDLWQSTHERKIVEETERVLDDSLA
jgi:hypothetical protein